MIDILDGDQRVATLYDASLLDLFSQFTPVPHPNLQTNDLAGFIARRGLTGPQRFALGLTADDEPLLTELLAELIARRHGYTNPSGELIVGPNRNFTSYDTWAECVQEEGLAP